MNPKFQLGELGSTKGARRKLSMLDMGSAFGRHINCDWGELCPEDKALNDLSVLNGGSRILSAHRSSKGVKFWIITEADRSATTVLLPEEYQLKPFVHESQHKNAD